MRSQSIHSQQLDSASKFDDQLVAYRRRLGDELMISRSTSWFRRDPELEKILERLLGVVDQLLRQHHSTSTQPTPRELVLASPRLEEAHRQRILLQLETDPAKLTLDLAIEVFDVLDRILIETGDARLVCEEIQKDLQWHRGSTSWLTWDSMKFQPTPPKAVTEYLSGKQVSEEALAAARHQLASFRHIRSNKYQADRARQHERVRSVHRLAWVLLSLVIGLIWALAKCCQPPVLDLGTALLIAVSGGLGSAVSGTIKARDRLTRASDHRAFRAGLFAQISLGAATAIVMILVLLSDVITLVDTNSTAGLAAIGFVVGFSEAFFLKTVERLSGSVEEKPGDATATKK